MFLITNFMFDIMKIFVVLKPKNYTQVNIVSKKGIKFTGEENNFIQHLNKSSL